MYLSNIKITVRQIAVLIGGPVLIYLGTPIILSAIDLVVNATEYQDPILLRNTFIKTFLVGLGFVIPGILLLIKSRLLRIILKQITERRENKQ